MTSSATIVRVAVPLLLLAGANLAVAEKVTFDPSIELEQGYIDNVEYGGDATSSDTFRSIQATLPYERETAKSTFGFSYRPSYFRQQKFSDLDRDEHRVDLRWNGDLSRANRFSTRLFYQKTQDQGTPEATGDPDLFLTRRTDRDLARADLRFTRTESPRWSWEVSANGASYDYSEIGGFAGAAGEGVEDRVEYGAGLRVLRSLTRSSNLGLRYGYQHFDLDVSGTEDSNEVSVTYDRRLADRMSFSTSLGVSRSAGDTLGGDEEKTGAVVGVRLGRTYQRFRLDIDAAHGPSSGGALSGTATQSSLGVAMGSQNRHRPWRWRAAPRFASRSPSGAGETIESYGIRGFVERGFGKLYAVRLDSDWFDQGSEDSVFQAGLAFLWYPLGEPERGGRGR